MRLVTLPPAGYAEVHRNSRWECPISRLSPGFQVRAHPTEWVRSALGCKTYSRTANIVPAWHPMCWGQAEFPNLAAIQRNGKQLGVAVIAGT